MMTRYALLEAPSTFGLQSDGVERLPAALLGHGLLEGIGARHAGRVLPGRARSGARDPAVGGVLNADALLDYAVRLADALGPSLQRDEFPVVLGGDCTIVLGAALALRRRGRHGLLFIDGQADFFQPEAEPNGEAASMDLALVTGYGPRALCEIEGFFPLTRPEDAVAFGFRDHDDQREYGSQSLPAELLTRDLPAIRRIGIERAAREAVAHLCRPELQGFWIHVDADSLDDMLMPAVDFRLPGGLSADELETVIRLAIASGHAMGIEVTIYNPMLDPEGRAGKLLTELLMDALG